MLDYRIQNEWGDRGMKDWVSSVVPLTLPELSEFSRMEKSSALFLSQMLKSIYIYKGVIVLQLLKIQLVSIGH